MSSMLYEEFNKELCKSEGTDIFGISDPKILKYWVDESRYTLVLDIKNDIAIKLYNCYSENTIRTVVYTNGIVKLANEFNTINEGYYENQLDYIGAVEMPVIYNKDILSDCIDKVKKLINKKHLYM